MVCRQKHEERRLSAMAETHLLLTSMTGCNGGERWRMRMRVNGVFIDLALDQ